VFLIFHVINDALEVICYKSRERLRDFDDIGAFGDIVTGKNLAKNLQIG
jgi:hypothetical protein